jgi:hypothetical protein
MATEAPQNAQDRLAQAIAEDDPAALAIAQFCNEPGSDADLRGHWSVMRGDPSPDRPPVRAEFEQHMGYCGVCRGLEAEHAPHADAAPAATDDDTDEA